MRSRSKHLGLENGRYWREKLMEERMQFIMKCSVTEYQLSEGEVWHFETKSLNTAYNRVLFHRILT